MPRFVRATRKRESWARRSALIPSPVALALPAMISLSRAKTGARRRRRVEQWPRPGFERKCWGAPRPSLFWPHHRPLSCNVERSISSESQLPFESYQMKRGTHIALKQLAYHLDCRAFDRVEGHLKISEPHFESYWHWDTFHFFSNRPGPDPTFTRTRTPIYRGYRDGRDWRPNCGQPS
jgi:hypothetical protein